MENATTLSQVNKTLQRVTRDWINHPVVHFWGATTLVVILASCGFFAFLCHQLCRRQTRGRENRISYVRHQSLNSYSHLSDQEPTDDMDSQDNDIIRPPVTITTFRKDTINEIKKNPAPVITLTDEAEEDYAQNLDYEQYKRQEKAKAPPPPNTPVSVRFATITRSKMTDRGQGPCACCGNKHYVAQCRDLPKLTTE